MSSSRVAFSNSTNIPRSPRKHSSSSSFSLTSKLAAAASSRKSKPTCTVSLANVSVNGDHNISLTSVPSTSSCSASQNVVPFPSSSVDSADHYSISEPDRSCLQLLRSSSVATPQPRVRASSILNPSLERRKRSTARLSQPPHLNELQGCSLPEQPPRKRPRLLLQKPSPEKPTKPSLPIASSDLKAFAIVQRCIAEGVLLRRCTRQKVGVSSAEAEFFDQQDVLLASHLRSRLIAQGMKTSVLVDIERELDMVAGMDMVMMDVDGRNIDVSPSIDSVDMDIDVEAPHLKPKSILSSPPRRSPPLAPAAPDCVLSPHQLVAALILRNRTTRKSSSTRPSAGSERIRRRSPLADSAI